jgi:hypothetical protein
MQIFVFASAIAARLVLLSVGRTVNTRSPSGSDGKFVVEIRTRHEMVVRKQSR